MPRPFKTGLDYFPLDTDMEQDDKVALVEAKYGIVGFAVVIKMFKKIYSSNGYYYDWNEQTQLLFSKQAGIHVDEAIKIIEDCIRWEMFDTKLYKKYKVLSSKRIQKTFFEATVRRREVLVYKEYVLNGVIADNNLVNVNIISINTNNSTQIEIEREIEKEKKVLHRNFVKLSAKEFETIQEEYGTKLAEDLIERLDNYIGSTNKQYKSHYFTIKSWARKENVKPVTDWRISNG